MAGDRLDPMLVRREQIQQSYLVQHLSVFDAWRLSNAPARMPGGGAPDELVAARALAPEPESLSSDRVPKPWKHWEQKLPDGNSLAARKCPQFLEPTIPSRIRSKPRDSRATWAIPSC